MNVSNTVAIVLGREGFETEDDFDSWVAFVAGRIDAMTGLSIDVDIKPIHGFQSDRIGGDDKEKSTIREALYVLWEEWCAL